MIQLSSAQRASAWIAIIWGLAHIQSQSWFAYPVELSPAVLPDCDRLMVKTEYLQRNLWQKSLMLKALVEYQYGWDSA